MQLQIPTWRHAAETAKRYLVSSPVVHTQSRHVIPTTVHTHMVPSACHHTSLGNYEIVKKLTVNLQQLQGAHPLAAAAVEQIVDTYVAATPSVERVLRALEQAASKRMGKDRHPQLWIDHLAFRTFGVPGLGIASVASVLEQLGYEQQQAEFEFPAKKLRATWFASKAVSTVPGAAAGIPDAALPRIFVSEIEVPKLSKPAQDVIHKAAAAALQGITSSTRGGRGSSSINSLSPAYVTAALLTGALPWPTPSLADHQLLASESEYAAWVLAHGYALNHVALAVHRMSTSPLPLADFCSTLTAQDDRLVMNPDGGIVKTSPDGLLLQSSLMSDMVPYGFSSGSRTAGTDASTGGLEHHVPGAYVEFVERRALPQHASLPAHELQEWQRRDGFEVANADRIFTSTARRSG